MSDVLAVCTTFWGLLMGLAPLLQIRVIVRSRTATGISVAWILILLVGFMLWLAYGIVQRDVPLIISNTVAATVSTGLLLTVLRFRRGVGTPGAAGGRSGVAH